MVVVESPGDAVDTVSVISNGKSSILSIESDSGILYSVVKELSRVILVNNNIASFGATINRLNYISDFLNKSDTYIAIQKLESLLKRLQDNHKKVSSYE